MTNPEDMNTINEDGKAFNGSYRPLGVAALFFISAVLIVLGHIFF